MNISRIGAFALVATGAIALAGCSDYGYGGGYGYARPYGYSNGYYGQPYGYDGYYDGYGYDYPYYGWYDNYYYPGVGIYLYDRGGTRYRWNDTQRQYWQSRRGTSRYGTPNWSQYRNYIGGTRTYNGGTGTGTYSGRTWNRQGTTGTTTNGTTGTYSGRTWRRR